MGTSDKRASVSIYCKIYTNNFSDEMIDSYATGKEIYNFLLKDANCCLPVKGDCNLWYLGSNEKFGDIIYNDRVWHWSWGEASFDTVQEFIDVVYKDGLFTKGQYLKLSAKIEEGRMIGDMYLIGEYLSEKIKPSTTTSTEKENNHVI
jgi:hypothetical protein